MESFQTFLSLFYQLDSGWAMYTYMYSYLLNNYCSAWLITYCIQRTWLSKGELSGVSAIDSVLESSSETGLDLGFLVCFFVFMFNLCSVIKFHVIFLSLFYVSLPGCMTHILTMTKYRCHYCRWRTAKLSPYGLWAGRDVYRATPCCEMDV